MARRLPIDQARLRPHLRLVEREQAPVFVAEFEYSSESAATTTSPKWKTPVGDDFERLRGLPAVAPGVRGVAPGTDPVQALLWKERRRRR